MVSGFHGDSLTSICASEDSRSLMGGVGGGVLL